MEKNDNKRILHTINGFEHKEGEACAMCLVDAAARNDQPAILDISDALNNAIYDKAQEPFKLNEAQRAVAEIIAPLPKEIKENILQEANRITSGDRRKAYGKVNKQLLTLAQLWAPILGKEPTMLQVALCLLQLKVSRELHQHNRDNIVDIAGYARVIEMLFDGE